MPHNLTEEQKAARITWCLKTLERFNEGASNHVYSIVSGDESWIYTYEPERKTLSTISTLNNELKPTKVTRSRSTSKKMIASFVSKSGHVGTICLEN
jgi:[histone H3]-lysine36 N-dimethyltransferase SETMAR